MYAKLLSENQIVSAPATFKGEGITIVNFNKNIEAMADHGYYPVEPDAAPPAGHEVDWQNCSFEEETSVETRIRKVTCWTTDANGKRVMVSEDVEYEQSVGVIHAEWAYKAIVPPAPDPGDEEAYQSYKAAFAQLAAKYPSVPLADFVDVCRNFRSLSISAWCAQHGVEESDIVSASLATFGTLADLTQRDIFEGMIDRLVGEARVESGGAE